MDDAAFRLNLAILESLGWFIAEDENDPDAAEFDVLLKCCRPDGTPIEEVPITKYLLAYYDESDESLEDRLWFFAPKYSTSLDNMESLLRTTNEYEYSVRSEIGINSERYYESEITQLNYDYDGEPFEVSAHYGTSETNASMSLAEAYLRCIGVYDG